MRVDSTTVAVVTGAASGLGEALARALDARGARVALCDVDGDGLARVAAELRHPCVHAVVDVADEAAVLGFAATVRTEIGRVDLVIANAGVAHMGSVAGSTTADYDRVLGIDLFGVIHTVRAFLPAMVEAGRGQVVTISSLFGLIGVPNQSAYCAAKAGVKGFTESLDQEVRGAGIGVLCVHPGAIATNIVHNQTRGDTREAPSTRKAAAIIANGLPPAVAASRILTAVERDRRQLLLGTDARIGAWIQRLAPVRYRDLIRWWAARTLR
jgi:NAD(P)-dependent dehydrogenase (short-subunit alcohol dehydrogenase family)